MGDYYGNYPQACGYGWSEHAVQPGIDVFVKEVCEVKKTLPSLFNIKVVRNNIDDR